MDTLLTTRLRQIADLLENMNRGPTQNATVCRNAAETIEQLENQLALARTVAEGRQKTSDEFLAMIQRLERERDTAISERDRLTDRMIAAGLHS
jgi:hypothetical protein